jgi:4'-phosphopantetheinyl transferase
MARVPVTAWIIGVDPRHASATAWISTRAILGHTLGVAPRDVQVSRRCAHCGHPSHGKPVVVDAPDVSFSLSHSGPWALVAVATGADVGADLEVLRRRVYLNRLARRALAPDELARWCDLPDERRLEGFLHAWTAKEAYLKAIGRGITRPLRDVSVRPPGWTMAAVSVEGAVAHVAVAGDADVRVRAWHAPRVSASAGTAD